MSDTMMLTPRSRPLGVSIIAALVGLGGMITLVGSILLFYGGGLAALVLNLIIPVVMLIYFLADHNVRTAFGR